MQIFTKLLTDQTLDLLVDATDIFGDIAKKIFELRGGYPIWRV